MTVVKSTALPQMVLMLPLVQFVVAEVKWLPKVMVMLSAGSEIAVVDTMVRLRWPKRDHFADSSKVIAGQWVGVAHHYQRRAFVAVVCWPLQILLLSDQNFARCNVVDNSRRTAENLNTPLPPGNRNNDNGQKVFAQGCSMLCVLRNDVSMEGQCLDTGQIESKLALRHLPSPTLLVIVHFNFKNSIDI